MAKSDPKDPPKIDFETAMQDLQSLVERLEQGELSLEESLTAFERGVTLTRTCQAALKEAEQKVEILLKKAGGNSTVEEFGTAGTGAAGSGTAGTGAAGSGTAGGDSAGR